MSFNEFGSSLPGMPRYELCTVHDEHGERELRVHRDEETEEIHIEAVDGFPVTDAALVAQIHRDFKAQEDAERIPSPEELDEANRHNDLIRAAGIGDDSDW